MKDKLSFNLDPHSHLALYEQLVAQLRKLMVAKKLAVGESLPSVEVLSRIAKVSPATIRRALEQLAEEGWLTLKRGARARVSDTAPQQSKWLEPAKVVSTSLSGGVDDDEFIPPLPLSRFADQMTMCMDSVDFPIENESSIELDFQPGVPDLKILQGKQWQDMLAGCIQQCLTTPRSNYEPAGVRELREQVAHNLIRHRDLKCTADDVFIVSGAQQARNLIARLLLAPGVKVAVEDPGSLNARLMWEAYEAEVVAIPTDESGLMLEELEKQQGISLLYLTPAAQFPTGAVLSQARRKKLITWAESSNVMLIEDDVFSEFTFESRLMPALTSFASRKRNIYIGSFSQSLTPSWRIGFMVVPEDLREPLSRLKWLADRCTSPIVQQLTLQLLKSGFLEKHIRKSQQAYEQKRGVVLNELERWPKKLATFTPVKGGLYQTIWLPPATDDVRIAELCADKDVQVLPLSSFYLQLQAKPGLLISFANMTEAQIVDGLKRIKSVLEDQHDA